MFNLLNFLLFCALSVSGQLHAQEATKAKRKSFDVNRMMQITYGSPSWNTDSTKIDSAYLLMRDKNTGKVVQIQLEESEPDSGQFSGRFNVNITDGSLSPEVYIPPQDLREGEKNYKKLFEMIQEGKLPRKPVIMKKGDKGHSIIDVYDTREQAQAALSAYDQEQKLIQKMRKTQALKKLNDEAAAAAAAEAERKAKLDMLALEAVKREQDRLRLEQMERQKAEERAAAERKLSEEQKAQRRAQAAQINDEALALYGAGQFEKAEEKFKAAMELDPENKNYAYKYGITLYRLNKFNEALVALKIATVDPAVETEKQYYMGLVYYRQGELDSALQRFREVIKSKDPQLAPAGLFYSGIILFTQEKYEAAKKSFETVIDTSKDPKLDTQAEEYLDKIASAIKWKMLREKRFTITGVIGAMYDSNVLLTPTSLPGGGAPSNTGDLRLTTLADLTYRAVFAEKHQWTPRATLNLTNSVKNTSAPGDPWIGTISAPYTYSSKAFGLPWRLMATPGYEMLYMDPRSSGTKTNQMNSYYVSVDDVFVMSKKWTSIYTLEFRNDKSLDPSSVGPDDLTSNKMTFRTVQSASLDEANKQALMPSLGIIRNTAKGSNKTYNRFDLGVTYVRPLTGGMSWNAGLALYQQTYVNLDPKRVDNNYTLSAGFSKPMKEWWTWGVMGSYSKNNSTDANFTYTKYMVMTTATFTTAF